MASDFVDVVAWPPPNGSRLSCGALKKKVSFNILRAPPASSACWAATAVWPVAADRRLVATVDHQWS